MKSLTCNGSLFRYGDGSEGDQGFLIAMICISCMVLLFLIYKMFRLCVIVFSYSNFHIHQTYKLYTLALLNLVMIIFSRKSQIDLMYQDKELQQGRAYSEIVIGYQVVNNLFAVISILTNSTMHLYNAFTWLLIAMDCDFTLLKQKQLNHSNQIEADQTLSIIKYRTTMRRRIKFMQNSLFYVVFPAILVICMIGTLKNTSGMWCDIVRIMIVLSTVIPLLVLTFAIAYFIRKFGDTDVSVITKGGLIYLLLTTIMRSLYFLVLVIKADEYYFSGEQAFAKNSVLNMLYFLFCTLAPILWMSVLSDLQQKNEQFALLRRSSGQIFRSTII